MPNKEKYTRVAKAKVARKAKTPVSPQVEKWKKDIRYYCTQQRKSLRESMAIAVLFNRYASVEKQKAERAKYEERAADTVRFFLKTFSGDEALQFYTDNMEEKFKKSLTIVTNL